MKAVLISVQPKWVEKIANGEKTIKVCKTRPKIDTPFKCYIYCTKAKEDRYILELHDHDTGKITRMDGKVIGEFVCDRICELKTRSDDYGRCWHEWNEEWCDEDKMQLSYDDIDKYLGEKQGYGWHISDLVIYDKPKALSEFKHWKNYNMGTWVFSNLEEVIRPPQSWCYVEKGE